ncbi:GerMN domain-containing protein [Solirubrobacter sp. CPCC 204708]|uniref:GerMN domain-containing protein n=1 Tax=Solirubrobacter deserti TaxID=2282478 RepID=A0ABT4RTU8_9ACTN|nr:peptidoglycan-binding protein [Solirubrobacter deserti]MBE2318692.1 GerMN domain-containing protein [Solirubrobacter deserti]MDA0141997.1 GerMN domain-containing protein [Solirubrobacter deserti]
MARLSLLIAAFVLLLPAVAEAKTVKIYVLRGEALSSVKRQAADGPEAALKVLLQGVTAAERKKGYGSAIPSGVTLTSAEVEDNKVELEFSGTFAASDVSYLARVAQVVYTATGADSEIEEVEIRGRTFTRADFAPPEEYEAPKPPTKKPAAPSDPRAVQDKLAQLGYLPEDAVTGKWDYRSQQAVLAFQSWEGLERDGIVGEMTQDRLDSAGRPLAQNRTGSGRKVEIHRGQGVILLIEAGRVVRVIHTSTGVGNNSTDLGTPPGNFKVTREVEEAWSVPFKMFMDHAVYWGVGLAIYGAADVPAGPASHGGARIPMPEVEVVFEFVEVGTPVRVI